MKKQTVARTKIWLCAFTLLLVAARVLAAPMAAPVVAGDWNGALSTGNGSLRVVLHVSQGSDGQLSATVDSPDQGVTGIPVSSISFKDMTVHLEIEKFGAAFDGTMNHDGSEISGTWKQGSASLPLAFKRVSR